MVYHVSPNFVASQNHRSTCSPVCNFSRRGLTWLSHLPWEQDDVGSNPTDATFLLASTLSPVLS